VAVVWVSLFVAYFSSYPIGFLVTTVAFAVYLLAVGSSRAARLRAAR
jgi:zinc/manganese transport system permease protein